jgi:hypothetical protein
MLFTWSLALASAVLATRVLKANRLFGIIFGVLLAQGLMFVGGHFLGLNFGPMVDIGGTTTPVLVDVVLALIGGFLGALLAKAVRRS